MNRHYKKWTKRDEEMLMELYKNRIINDALVGDNTRLKNKNQKLASALTEAKNIIEEALKDEPISSDNGSTTAI